MHDQEQSDASGKADCVPAFLAVDDALHVRYGLWVFEHTQCGLKRETVFSPVDPVFVLIPDEYHCIHKTVSQNSLALQLITRQKCSN